MPRRSMAQHRISYWKTELLAVVVTLGAAVILMAAFVQGKLGWSGWGVSIHEHPVLYWGGVICLGGVFAMGLVVTLGGMICLYEDARGGSC
jgi:hypothetical protein